MVRQFVQFGCLAQRRLARGVKLNHDEATALVANNLQELARDGRHSVAELMDVGRSMLGRRQVLPSVPATLTEIQIEATFPAGTFLVTVHDPICTENADLKLSLYGSFLPIPEEDSFPPIDESSYAKHSAPGTVKVVKGERIRLNENRERIRLRVTSKGDRPVQVGSHYPFVETNPSLQFDRIQSRGYRLDIPSGTSVRFEPGDTKTVTLVKLGGSQVIHGGNNLASGLKQELSDSDEFMKRIMEGGFLHSPEPQIDRVFEVASLDRQSYCNMFGPTAGDLLRLGLTDLWVKIEKDCTTYGEELTFGGGKTTRDGMGQAAGVSDKDCLDSIITNTVIIDWTGIFKADIGIKDGRIFGIGKAGNPYTMDGVSKDLVVGSCTDVIAGENTIVTAGGFDTHVHFLCPQQANEAISSGITTLLGGGTGPSTGTVATTCTPGAFHIRRMLKACDSLPVNVGITGKGSESLPGPLREQCLAGAVGLKVHEDWGATPSTIDNCLAVCDEFDVQCLLHSDTLNESGFVEQTIKAFKDRTIHTYHTEGAGGGHAPDIISIVEHPNVLPSSTNPTRPFTTNTLDEHLDMLMTCHHMNRNLPEDIALAESRIRAETIAAEDVLHDLGAISMMSSDSQAMGRCGEVILRTWHTAHKNKLQRGFLEEDMGTSADNFRVKRYISKYTINPAIAHGMSHIIGSIETGKLADLVIWDPSKFGVKPKMILKAGMISHALMGDPNASISIVEPLMMRPMYGALDPGSSLTFVSQASLKGEVQSYGLRKKIEAVKNCRNVGKKDMKYNSTRPKMKVDPEKYTVEADGLLCKAEPAAELPLTQAYFFF